jgi:phospholipid/cholesterol/gamma-HCH transport system substrate-binding protein
MITARTKKQLVIFVIIALLGVTYVGARYAKLDRLVLDRSYAVTASLEDSGGIFEGAEVTYRGVTIGRVGSMEVTDDGVDVTLDIENANDDIPADAKALVGNRSAVGEQYVELQPQSDSEPYLEDGSRIEQSNTEIPISTVKWLTDTQALVNSIPKDDFRTVISEFGKAFADGGDDLGRLIDSSTSFIETADANFEVPRQLIRDSNTVLGTQLDKASAIRTFARDLALFSDTLAASDPDLRRVIASGSATATQLRTFLEENEVNLGKLINNLVTTGEVQLRHLPGIEMVLIMYPYVVAGGFVVNAREGNVNNAHFGLILEQNPQACTNGYQSTNERDPNTERGNAPMNERARCAEPPTVSNARGAQNANRVAPWQAGPAIATYDGATGEVKYGDRTGERKVTYTGGAHEALGKESWKWLLIQPLASQK